MSETVVFSQLSRKFIDENDATPPSDTVVRWDQRLIKEEVRHG